MLTFLQSVGRRQEAEYYLKLFRELPKASFAVILADPMVLDETPGSVVEALRFLSQLGLFPVIAVGADAAASDHAEELRELLESEGVEQTRVTPNDANWVAQAKAALTSERSVVADLDAESSDPFSHLEQLLIGLSTRKLVVLRPQGGLGPKEQGHLSLTPGHRLATSESGISVINLRSDLALLEKGSALAASDLRLLHRINSLHALCPQLLTSVASPFNLLRELFTIKGAGTLVKTGSGIEHFTSYRQLDQARLIELLESTFERELAPDFLKNPPLDIYLESNYRGAAILVPGVEAAFLTKFAVSKRAQGEGIGRDLWEAMLRDHSTVYWRSRPDNPAIGWYQSECDGMQRTQRWLVFWKGVAPESIPRIVEDAVTRRADFEPVPRN